MPIDYLRQLLMQTSDLFNYNMLSLDCMGS